MEKKKAPLLKMENPSLVIIYQKIYKSQPNKVTTSLLIENRNIMKSKVMKTITQLKVPNLKDYIVYKQSQL